MKLWKDLNTETGTNIINNSDIICTFGLSMGETDKMWWSILVEWLSLKEEHRLILYCRDDNYTEVNPRVIMTKKDKVLNDFLYSSGAEQDICNSVKNKIIIFFNKDIFNFQFLKRDEDNVE